MLVIGFPQCCRKCILRVQRNNLRQILLFGIKQVIYWIFWSLNEKLPEIYQNISSKVLKKNLQQVRKNIWRRWFNVNFKCLCLFLYFEQDSSRQPAKNFLKQCCNCNQFFHRNLLKKNSCSTNTGSFLRWLSKNFSTFKANVSAGLLQLHSTCQEQHSEVKCNFWKVFPSAHIFLDSEPKICGLSSKKCRKFCRKCFRCMDNNNDSRINFRSIIWLYLYSDFEQKVFDFPRKVFVRVVATAVDASRGMFGRIVWFLKIRVFYKRFMKFEPKDCGNLSQIFNERLCELLSKCVEEILEHFSRKKNNFSYIL